MTQVSLVACFYQALKNTLTCKRGTYVPMILACMDIDTFRLGWAIQSTYVVRSFYFFWVVVGTIIELVGFMR